METYILVGFGFLLLGAVCGGSFGLPSKYAGEKTPWEVLWGPFFLFVTIILPLTLGPVIVKDYFAVFSKAGFAAMLLPLVFGFLWGLGSMTLGLSFAFIGLSLAYALNYGAQIITGSMGTLLIHSPEKIPTDYGMVILAGVAVCLIGVIVSGRAAMLKERSAGDAGNAPDEEADGTAAAKPKMLMGIVVGILSGVLCACYAIAASFADDLGGAAGTLGNESARAAWAVMSVIVWGGAVSSLLYCGFKLSKNRTWGHLAQKGIGRILLLALIMAVLHDAAIFLFGLGYSELGGKLGISVGYPAFMSFAIIVGNIHGFRTGEWKGAGGKSKRWIVAGIVLLIIGVSILGKGRAMEQSSAAKAPAAEKIK